VDKISDYFDKNKREKLYDLQENETFKEFYMCSKNKLKTVNKAIEIMNNIDATISSLIGQTENFVSLMTA